MTAYLLQHEGLIKALGGSLMRSNPCCWEGHVVGVPVVRPQVDGAVVYAQEVALRNEVLANLGRP